MNEEMAERAANEENSIGQWMHGRGLDLDDGDVADIEEGLSRIRNAQEHLQARIGQLSKPR
jgi:hypothetical protein